MRKLISIISIIALIVALFIPVKSSALEYTEGNDKKYDDAKFIIMSYNNRWALKIEGIDKIDKGLQVYFSNKDEIPSIDELSKTNHNLSYNDEGYYTYSYIDDYVQSSDDLYAWVYVKNIADYTITVIAQSGKIEKPEFNKYSDAFSKMSGMSNKLSNICFSEMGDFSGRKFKLKIGRISDVNKLIQLKNENNETWASLLKGSQSDNQDVVYNDVVNVDGVTDPIVFNGYHSVTDILEIENTLNKLQDKKYYYVYVKFDDEKGKYRPIECVTVAEAFVNKGSESWHLDFFRCDGDFSWDDVPEEEQDKQSNTETDSEKSTNSDTEKDEQKNEAKTNSEEKNNTKTTDGTVADTKMPKTGEKIGAFVCVSIAIAILIYSVKRNNKLKNIK